jgi:hypothetical protein
MREFRNMCRAVHVFQYRFIEDAECQ